MNKRRVLSFLLVLILCFNILATTAFAYGDDPDPEVIINTGQEAPKPTTPKPTTPAPTEPAPTEPVTVEDGDGFSETGNLITRDLLFDKNTNKQFITVETRNGEVFYIIIDYDKPTDEDGNQYETFFLNLVDEEDLLALLEEAGFVVTCDCSEKCMAGQVNMSCAICSKNMTECVGIEKIPETEPAPTEPSAPVEENKGSPALVIVLLLAGAGAGAYFYIKKKQQPDPKTKGKTDLDDYDYGMDDDEEYADFESYEDDEDK